jgi:hypothetical protein
MEFYELYKYFFSYSVNLCVACLLKGYKGCVRLIFVDDTFYKCVAMVNLWAKRKMCKV